MKSTILNHFEAILKNAYGLDVEKNAFMYAASKYFLLIRHTMSLYLNDFAIFVCIIQHIAVAA